MKYLGHSANDLYSDLLPRADVDSSNDFAECSLTQKGYKIVALAESAVLVHYVVPVLIVDFLLELLTLEHTSVRSMLLQKEDSILRRVLRVQPHLSVS